MKEMQVEIDSKWFNENFFDIKKHRPQKNQIIAKWTGIAHFVDGWIKRNLIEVLLKNKVGAESAQKIMKNIIKTTDFDSIRIPFEMSSDLLSGMTPQEVIDKEYKMVIECYYWTKRENVPTDDPHWTTIDVLNKDNIDKQLDKYYNLD